MKCDICGKEKKIDIRIQIDNMRLFLTTSAYVCLECQEKENGYNDIIGYLLKNILKDTPYAK